MYICKRFIYRSLFLSFHSLIPSVLSVLCHHFLCFLSLYLICWMLWLSTHCEVIKTSLFTSVIAICVIIDCCDMTDKRMTKVQKTCLAFLLLRLSRVRGAVTEIKSFSTVRLLTQPLVFWCRHILWWFMNPTSFTQTGNDCLCSRVLCRTNLNKCTKRRSISWCVFPDLFTCLP